MNFGWFSQLGPSLCLHPQRGDARVFRGIPWGVRTWRSIARPRWRSWNWWRPPARPNSPGMRCWAKLTMAWGFLWIWLSNTYQCNIYIYIYSCYILFLLLSLLLLFIIYYYCIIITNFIIHIYIYNYIYIHTNYFMCYGDIYPTKKTSCK